MRTLRNILLLIFFCWLYLFAVGPTTEDRNPQQSPEVTSATPNTKAAPTKRVSTQPTPAQPHHLSSCGDDLTNSDLAARNTALQAVVAERMRIQIHAQGAIKALRTQRSALMAEYQNRLSTFKPTYPDMLRLKAQINQIDQEIKSEGDIIIYGANPDRRNQCEFQPPPAPAAPIQQPPPAPAAPIHQPPPFTCEGSHSATRAPDNANKASALTALQHAAERGELVAQWKLGRMYADGDGVARDDLRAFNYFNQIANSHPDEVGTPEARFVANAFVALGCYYLTGIPNSKITTDRARARDMFGYAATYFGDADAQYELGRLYLSGSLGDPRQAARWFQLAATKGHCRAEVALGDMLFQGQAVPRQAARGLMWLTLGRDCAGPDETWVKPLYDNAFKRASDDERAMALVYLEDWLKGRHD